MITSCPAARLARRSSGQVDTVPPKPAMSRSGGRGLEALPKLRWPNDGEAQGCFGAVDRIGAAIKVDRIGAAARQRPKLGNPREGGWAQVRWHFPWQLHSPTKIPPVVAPVCRLSLHPLHVTQRLHAKAVGRRSRRWRRGAQLLSSGRQGAGAAAVGGGGIGSLDSRRHNCCCQQQPWHQDKEAAAGEHGVRSEIVWFALGRRLHAAATPAP